MVIVEALLGQILPIRAEERLEAINDGAVASGAVKKGASDNHLRELRRQAGARPRAATMADLSAIGIKVVHG